MKRIIVVGLFCALILSATIWFKKVDSKTPPHDQRAEIIDAYFAQRNMPLAGYGKIMVETADEYGLDWRLLPAIAIREQSGGKVLPRNCHGHINYNAFGWGSGRICFSSFDQAIKTVGMKLGTLPYYKGKELVPLLQTYNPPSVVPTYAYEVIKIMEAISKDDLPTT